MVVCGERGGWAAVGAEQLVGGPGLPRHAGGEACGGRGDGAVLLASMAVLLRMVRARAEL